LQRRNFEGEPWGGHGPAIKKKVLGGGEATEYPEKLGLLLAKGVLRVGQNRTPRKKKGTICSKKRQRQKKRTSVGTKKGGLGEKGIGH